MTKRRRSTSQTIGSILVGFDHQVFRATKPPAELVESARPLPAVAGSDGSMLSIAVPDPAPLDRERDPAPPDRDPPTDRIPTSRRGTQS